MLTGSEYSVTEDYPWLEPLLDYVRRFFECGKPMLGVCYSHQLIARALHGRRAVSKALVPEMTYTPIEVTKSHPLFHGLPNPFWVMSAHYDQVTRLPEGFEAVARTRDCAIQAMVHKTKPVLGLQFHPEIEIERGRKCVLDEWEKLRQHGIEPEVLLAQIPSVPTGADRVLRNFLSFVR